MKLSPMANYIFPVIFISFFALAFAAIPRGLDVGPDENTSIKTNRIQDMMNDAGNKLKEGGSCRVEFQVTKHLIGDCVNLGKSARGCVAGNYLHPFHPDCL